MTGKDVGLKVLSYPHIRVFVPKPNSNELEEVGYREIKEILDPITNKYEPVLVLRGESLVDEYEKTGKIYLTDSLPL